MVDRHVELFGDLSGAEFLPTAPSVCTIGGQSVIAGALDEVDSVTAIVDGRDRFITAKWEDKSNPTNTRPTRQEASFPRRPGGQSPGPTQSSRLSTGE